MTRATLVAATLCAFVATGSAFAEPPKVAEASAPLVATVAAAVPADAVAPAEPVVAAKPTPPPPPAVTLVAKVDLSAQRLTVIENGEIKYSWAISSGTQGHATPAGNFKPEWTAKMWYSRQYDMAPMPHAVFFKNGAAIHATQSTGALGRPASHGCVRLAPGNAATFYGLVQRHGLSHTRVNVFGTPPHPKQNNDAVASRRRPSPQRYAATYPSNGGSLFSSGASFFAPAPVAYRPVRYAPTAYRY